IGYLYKNILGGNSLCLKLEKKYYHSQHKPTIAVTVSLSRLLMKTSKGNGTLFAFTRQTFHSFVLQSLKIFKNNTQPRKTLVLKFILFQQIHISSIKHGMIIQTQLAHLNML